MSIFPLFRARGSAPSLIFKYFLSNTIPTCQASSPPRAAPFFSLKPQTRMLEEGSSPHSPQPLLIPSSTSVGLWTHHFFISFTQMTMNSMKTSVAMCIALSCYNSHSWWHVSWKLLSWCFLYTTPYRGTYRSTEVGELSQSSNCYSFFLSWNSECPSRISSDNLLPHQHF